MQNPLSSLAIETAIYPHLLRVTPDTSLEDISNLIGQVQASSWLPSYHQSLTSSWMNEVIASCVLVMEGMQLIELLTQQDLSELVLGLNFKAVKVTDAMLRHLISLRKSQLQDIFSVVKAFHQYRSHLPILSDRTQLLEMMMPNSIRHIQPSVSIEQNRAALLQQQVSQLQAEKVQLQNRNAELVLALETERQERQKAEAALRKVNQELEIKVEKRTTQLKTANEQLQREIGSRHLANVALQQQLAAIEAANDGIAILNQNGEYIYLNSAHIHIFGYGDTSELLGLTWQQLYSQDEIKWFEQNVFPQLLHKGYWQGETTAKRKDGTTFASEVSLTWLKNGGMICVCRDITRRKQAQEELCQALEREKELSELKSRFITMTSHEFRTPLTAILGSTELLRHYSHTWTDNKKLLYFNRIQANVQHMIQLLEDVLLLGKAEAGKLKFEPKKLDLVQLCRTLVAELEHIPGTKHKFVFTEQCKCTNVYMDEQLIRHILGNLLSNAIKYSPVGSTVRFALICQDETASFQIQDQGIGIPQEDRQHLFESFYRASNVSNIAGTGLGLAIVKKAVDLHGGDITVDSQVGVGTTFTVTIGRIGNWYATHPSAVV